MAKLPIIIVPDPVLKQVAQPVQSINPLIRQLANDMAETMYAAPGIGLAANQVNSLHRLFVIDVAFRENSDSRAAITMINPDIVWESEEMSVWEEGCLSIPGQFAEVKRPKSVRVRYLDLTGQWQERLVDGLESHCVQHELDHLNGVLFIDHISSLKRNMILRRLKKSQNNVEL
ncbi:MAG: peptide deformylase [Pseudomonadota bacterium]